MRNGKYNLVIAPENYPGTKYRDRYCYEHHLVWWQTTGQIIKSTEVLHHINHNPADNQFSNLQKLPAKIHNKQHNALRKKPLIELDCAYCGSRIYRARRNYFFKVKQGQENFYCSQYCQMKLYWNNSRIAKR